MESIPEVATEIQARDGRTGTRKTQWDQVKEDKSRTKGTKPCDVASSGLTVEKEERRAGTCDFGDLILSKVRITGERQTRGKR